MSEVAPESILIEIDDMFCTSCARAVETVIGRVDGVREVRVGFSTHVASVVADDPASVARVRDAAIAAAIKLGYHARPWSFRPAGLDDGDAGLGELGLRVALGGFLGMWVMLAQLALYLAPELASPDQLLLAKLAGVFATPVVFVVGARFHLAAWRTVRAGVPGMDVLVSLGSLGAWSLSCFELLRGSQHVWFDAATLLIVLLLAGRLLEARARATGVNAVRELLDLTPETVTLRTPDGDVEVVAATVEPGQVVVIAAAARIPLDGVVVRGRSTVDRAVLTGESTPIVVGPGAEVQAGCSNGLGSLEVTVSAGVGERMLDRIALQVRAALDQRAEVLGLAERLAERLVPVVLSLAVLTFVGVWWSTSDPVTAAVRALTVLVVTCPCALGVAAPLVRAVAIGRAAKRGILFRDADALERAGQVERVVFDKTGTLTRGRPTVVDVQCFGAFDRSIVVDVAARAEAGSRHPLARAIRALAPDTPRTGEHREQPGRGVRWELDGTVVRVGARAWFEGLPAPPQRGATEVWVEIDGAIAGRLLVVDGPDPFARSTLARLRAMGLRLGLWSGDAAGPVASLARTVGLSDDEIRSQMSPLDKANAVARVERDGELIAFVGDGINDAPALASATVGVAVEAATDAARAAADIVVRAHGLGQVVTALAIAKQARRRTHANVVWALAYNGFAVPLAMTGWIQPQVAALAMVLSSISVTVNATRRFNVGRPDHRSS